LVNNRHHPGSPLNSAVSLKLTPYFQPKKVSVSKPRYILDAGPLIAYANSRDVHHSWACGVLDAIGEVPIVPEIVIAEACWVLRSSKSTINELMTLTQSGAVRLVPVLGPSNPKILEWMMKYWPRMDLADACVLSLAERNPQARIITTDLRDFGVYRINGKPLPITAPHLPV
jgi:predicted nucleic acid-binding protein